LGEVVGADDLTHHLSLLGVSEEGARVYCSLIDQGSADVAGLAATNTTSVDAIHDILAELIDAGLVGRTGPTGERFAPVAPEAGLKVLTARRESEVNAAMVATLNAYAEFRRSRLSPATDHLVEVVTGPAMLERVEQAERNDHHEERRLYSPP
jgi:sugar-specific transcriptional regulator TrmB